MSAKVWLVDDDLSLREALGFLLKAMDYEVADFADYTAFNAATVSQPALQGCLLLDVRTRNMDGLHWLTGQSERYPLLPIIIMTDHDSIDGCQRAFGQHVFDFFVKPLEIEPLLQVIHQAMKESEQRTVR